MGGKVTNFKQLYESAKQAGAADDVLEGLQRQIETAEEEQRQEVARLQAEEPKWQILQNKEAQLGKLQKQLQEHQQEAAEIANQVEALEGTKVSNDKARAELEHNIVELE